LVLQFAKARMAQIPRVTVPKRLSLSTFKITLYFDIIVRI